VFRAAGVRAVVERLTAHPLLESRRFRHIRAAHRILVQLACGLRFCLLLLLLLLLRMTLPCRRRGVPESFDNTADHGSRDQRYEDRDN